MRYGSLCSGIEAASVAWEPLGWQPAWFAAAIAFVLSHYASRELNTGPVRVASRKIRRSSPLTRGY